MIRHQNWIRRQVINLWFLFTQEEIAQQLLISLGTVNNIVQEYIKSNDWAHKIRDMMMAAKKQGVNINQIFSNLRYENAVKKFASDGDKFEVLLRGLSYILNQNEADPAVAARNIYEVVELAYKQQKFPSEILYELKLNIEQNRVLQDSNTIAEERLNANDIRIEVIDKFIDVSNKLGVLGITELDQISNLLTNIKENQEQPERIVDYASRFISLSQELNWLYSRIEELQEKEKEELANLADIQIQSTLRKEAIDTYNKLAKKGYSEQAIADMLQVIHDVAQECKGRASTSCFLAQLRSDLSMYGSTLVANVNLQFENNDLTFRILQSKINLKYEQHTLG
jgi:uncharacterized protein YnzC (UPF0291/DUF896 family)